MAYSQISIICKWLGCMKGLVLLIQSCKISRIQGNNRITMRSPNKDPILMVSQKPEISNQTNDSLQGTFASKDEWIEGYTVGHCDIVQLP